MDASPLGLRSVVRAVPQHLSSNIGEEAVILGLEDGQYYGLNATGARIWNLLRTAPHRVSDIIARIQHDYDVDEPVLSADVLALLSEMIRRGLVCRG